MDIDSIKVPQNIGSIVHKEDWIPLILRLVYVVVGPSSSVLACSASRGLYSLKEGLRQYIGKATKGSIRRGEGGQEPRKGREPGHTPGTKMGDGATGYPNLLGSHPTEGQHTKGSTSRSRRTGPQDYRSEKGGPRRDRGSGYLKERTRWEEDQIVSPEMGS